MKKLGLLLIFSMLYAVEPVDRVCSQIRLKFTELYGNIPNQKMSFSCNYKLGCIDSIVFTDERLATLADDKSHLDIMVDELCRFFAFAVFYEDSLDGYGSYYSPQLRMLAFVKDVGWMHAFYPDLKGVFRKHLALRKAGKEKTYGAGDIAMNTDLMECWQKGRKEEKIVNEVKEQTMKVPKLIGKNITTAMEIILQNDFKVGKIKYEIRDGVNPNIIVSQYPPAGAVAETGYEIDIVVSTGDK